MDQFNIFLIGFMGTGKTTIANCLSRKLDRKVVEMDQIISERAGMSISIYLKHMENSIFVIWRQAFWWKRSPACL